MTEHPQPMSDSEMEPGGLPGPIEADGALESGADLDTDPDSEAGPDLRTPAAATGASPAEDEAFRQE